MSRLKKQSLRCLVVRPSNIILRRKQVCRLDLDQPEILGHQLIKPTPTQPAFYGRRWWRGMPRGTLT